MEPECWPTNIAAPPLSPVSWSGSCAYHVLQRKSPNETEISHGRMRRQAQMWPFDQGDVGFISWLGRWRYKVTDSIPMIFNNKSETAAETNHAAMRVHAGK